jgi:hypothetical protein
MLKQRLIARINDGLQPSIGGCLRRPASGSGVLSVMGVIDGAFEVWLQLVTLQHDFALNHFYHRLTLHRKIAGVFDIHNDGILMDFAHSANLDVAVMDENVITHFNHSKFAHAFSLAETLGGT